MTVQYSVALRNAQLDQIEPAIGASGTLEIRTLAPPTNCAAADVGTVLATIPLPTTGTDVLAAAATGSVSKTPTAWTVAATGTGDAAHFRIKTSGGTCVIQGTVSATTGSGDMKLDNINIASGQTVTVTSFTLSAGNA